MMDGLKPCPFCGNEVKVEKIPLWYGNGRGYSGCYEFKIKCESCGCTVDQPKNDSVYRSEEKARENAIEAWNRRATIEPERKMGKWILVTDNNGQHFICYHCGEWRYHQCQKFCGECGAKMEEPEDIPMEYFESGGK